MYRSDRPRWFWLALLIAALVVLWLSRSTTNRPMISGWNASGGGSGGLAGAALPRGELVVSAEGVYTDAEAEQLRGELAQALGYVADRFGSGATGAITAAIVPEPNCGLYGAAYTQNRTVQVHTCSSNPRARAVNILAHEFVHQLAHDRYGAAHLRSDLILLEGLATWGAGKYWLGDQPDFRSFIRPSAQAQTLLPLATSYVGRPIADMNALYYQWASFVEFLLNNYGRERFDALYISGASEPGSADYRGVYGRDLPALEAEWQAWLLR